MSINRIKINEKQGFILYYNKTIAMFEWTNEKIFSEPFHNEHSAQRTFNSGEIFQQLKQKLLNRIEME